MKPWYCCYNSTKLSIKYIVFSRFPDIKIETESNSTSPEKSTTNSIASLPQILGTQSPEDETDRTTENQVFQKQKLQKKKQSRSKRSHIPPPPPLPPPLYLPPLERRWELLEIRRKLHRENFAAQKKQQHSIPVYFQPGLDIGSMTVQGITAKAHTTAERKKELLVGGLPLHRKSIPNYNWQQNRSHQSIARGGPNLTGMDLVKSLMNYPNAVHNSPDITLWMGKKKEDPIHPKRLRLPPMQPASQTKTFINSCILGSKLNDKYEQHSVIYKWKDIHHASSQAYAPNS